MSSLKTIALFRCTKQQYAKSFCQHGSIKFNSPKAWIEMEKEQGKGRGDSNEGIFATLPILDFDNILNSQHIRKNITGNPVNNITHLRSTDILELPCFCVFGLNNTNFLDTSVDKKGIIHHTGIVAQQYFNDFSDSITKESIQLLEESEQPVLIMITNPHEFFRRLRKSLQEFGFKEEEILISPVTYMDKTIPFICPMKFPHELFLKDLEFSHQSEIRVIINTTNQETLKKLNQNGNIISIGNLEDISHIEKFYFDDMMMELNGEKLLYTLPEPITYKIEDLPYDTLINIIQQISRGDVPGIESREEIQTHVDYLCNVVYKKYNIHITVDLP